MNKKKIVIASHSYDEAITKCVMDNRKSIDADITLVLLQDLISDYEIFDELSDSVNVIRWYKGEELCVSNIDHDILNRVLYIPNTLFSDFIAGDKEYAQREFEAYIGFAFNSFSGVGNQSSLGVCVDIQSLPQQWNTLKNRFEMKVPRYYWGPHYHNSLTKTDILVYSSIYNYLNWSISSFPAEENHVFAFEKPQGEPVFILSIGNERLITSNIPLSVNMKGKIQEIVRSINKCFNYFISEILVFVEGENLNFGCINHDIVKSKNNVLFEKFVCGNFLSEFYKCRN